MTRTSVVLAGLAFVVAASAGCSAPPHVVDWSAEKIALESYPDSYRRVYVRQVSVDEVTSVGAAALPGEHYPVDAEVIRGALVDALGAVGFRDVVRLDSPDGLPGGPGLVLDVAFTDVALCHAGESGDARLAFWLWIFTGLPGLGVRDQLYELRASARAQITDAASGDVLVPWEPLARPEPEPLALNFHERTHGFWPYCKCWVVPPSIIAIDEREVLREIAPSSLRAPIQSLVQLFNQIGFSPVHRIEFHPVECPGVKVESIRAPRDADKDDTISLTLVLWIDQGVRTLREVRVGGRTRLDLEAVRRASSRVRVELALGDVVVPPGEAVPVELVLEGSDEPRLLLRVVAAATADVRAERSPRAEPVETEAR